MALTVIFTRVDGYCSFLTVLLLSSLPPYSQYSTKTHLKSMSGHATPLKICNSFLFHSYTSNGFASPMTSGMVLSLRSHLLLLPVTNFTPNKMGFSLYLRTLLKFFFCLQRSSPRYLWDSPSPSSSLSQISASQWILLSLPYLKVHSCPCHTLLRFFLNHFCWSFVLIFSHGTIAVYIGIVLI